MLLFLLLVSLLPVASVVSLSGGSCTSVVVMHVLLQHLTIKVAVVHMKSIITKVTMVVTIAGVWVVKSKYSSSS